jgi:hypothetical protein
MADVNRRLADSFEQTISSAERNAASFERSAAASERAANTAAASAKRETAATRVARSISTTVRQIAQLDAANNATEQSTTRVSRALERVGFGSSTPPRSCAGSTPSSAAYCSPLRSSTRRACSRSGHAGAQLFAVAAAAGQAAVGIGAALGAGMAQAIPSSASSRHLRAPDDDPQGGQAAEPAAADSQPRRRSARRQQATAADSISAAEERVADAHRNTIRC